jgi:hypothetical protein
MASYQRLSLEDRLHYKASRIYILDEDPAEAARDLIDGLLGVAVMSAAAVLSEAHWKTDRRAAKNLCAQGRIGTQNEEYWRRPMVWWASSTRENWLWLRCYALTAADELHRRFNHAPVPTDVDEIRAMPPILLAGGLTPFMQDLPARYYGTDAVRAYRHFLFSEFGDVARWTGRGLPSWWPGL